MAEPGLKPKAPRPLTAMLYLFITCHIQMPRYMHASYTYIPQLAILLSPHPTCMHRCTCCPALCLYTPTHNRCTCTRIYTLVVDLQNFTCMCLQADVHAQTCKAPECMHNMHRLYHMHTNTPTQEHGHTHECTPQMHK